MGYQAVGAQNSQEAIACAEAEQPALIFMNMGLPDCDGINTSAILKYNRKTSHIPIVALTAWMSELWREKASRLGIETYLFTSDVRADDRGIHCESPARGNAIILSIFHRTQFESRSNLVKCTIGFPSTLRFVLPIDEDSLRNLRSLK
jgi:PleD family two-component response regulator